MTVILIVAGKETGKETVRIGDQRMNRNHC